MKYAKLALTTAITTLLAVLNTSVAANISNGDVTQINAGNSLLSTVNSAAGSDEQWFGYQVDMEPGNGSPCCYSGSGFERRSCTLGSRHSGWGNDGNFPNDSSGLNVYFKLEDGQPKQLFFAGNDCPVDAGGNKVVDIQGVSQSQSIEFLAALVDGEHRRKSGRVIGAIALHQGETAQNQLLQLADNKSEDIRHRALFWLGEARYKAGYEALVDIVDDKGRDIDDRTKAIFALSVNDYEKSSNKLIQLAKHGEQDDIQSKALFWLSQSDNPQTANVVKDVLASSSPTDVKEKAVFALSQLKSDEGWTMLVDLAKSAEQRDIREKAIFWLSQRGKGDAKPVLLEILNGNSPSSIKEKVVFALSQLPDEQSTSALLAVLKSSHSKAIKKKALFWLGQSRDPQAIAAIEEILTQ